MITHNEVMHVEALVKIMNRTPLQGIEGQQIKDPAYGAAYVNILGEWYEMTDAEVTQLSNSGILIKLRATESYTAYTINKELANMVSTYKLRHKKDTVLPVTEQKKYENYKQTQEVKKEKEPIVVEAAKTTIKK